MHFCIQESLCMFYDDDSTSFHFPRISDLVLVVSEAIFLTNRVCLFLFWLSPLQLGATAAQNLILIQWHDASGSLKPWRSLRAAELH